MKGLAAVIALLLILPLSAGSSELEGMESRSLHSHISYSYGLNSTDIIAHRGAS